MAESLGCTNQQARQKQNRKVTKNVLHSAVSFTTIRVHVHGHPNFQRRPRPPPLTTSYAVFLEKKKRQECDTGVFSIPVRAVCYPTHSLHIHTRDEGGAPNGKRRSHRSSGGKVGFLFVASSSLHSCTPHPLKTQRSPHGPSTQCVDTFSTVNQPDSMLSRANGIGVDWFTLLSSLATPSVHQRRKQLTQLRR